MKPNQKDPDHLDHLRQRAEEALRGQTVDLNGLHPEDVQYLLHELQVHQVELRMQNDELRQVQFELEVSRDRYADLYHFAPTGYCTLNRKGVIIEVNQTLTTMLGITADRLIGAPLAHFVERADRDEVFLHCRRAFAGHQRQVSEIHLREAAGKEFCVRLESVIAPGDENRLMSVLSDLTEQRRMERALLDSTAQREVQHRLLDQREQERQQVAHDLHDGPVQELTGITFFLRSLIVKEDSAAGMDRAALREELEAIQSSLQALISELRMYAGELRPPTLTKFGLEQTIRSHAEAFQVIHPDLRILLDLHQTGEKLPETIGVALFRIYQQALNNIIKHAGASEARVHMEKDERQVRLQIQDNGRGFVVLEDWIDLARQGHLGLLGMRERAEAVGGNLDVISTPGGGTQVITIVPLETPGGGE